MRERMRMLEFSTFCVNPVGELEELRVTVCVCVCVHMSERTTESAVCVHYSEIYAFCTLVHCALHAHKTTQSRNIAVPHTCAGTHTHQVRSIGVLRAPFWCRTLLRPHGLLPLRLYLSDRSVCMNGGVERSSRTYRSQRTHIYARHGRDRQLCPSPYDVCVCFFAFASSPSFTHRLWNNKNRAAHKRVFVYWWSSNSRMCASETSYSIYTVVAQRESSYVRRGPTPYTLRVSVKKAYTR